MKEPIISVSGLRGIMGQSLSPDIAARYASAFVATLPAGAIVVTRDGRESGPVLLEAVERALLKAGRKCYNADVAATPTTGVLVRHLGAAGGIQISASHNPPEYNGLKLFDGRGRVIPAEMGQRVSEVYHGSSDSEATSESSGTCEELTDTTSAHLQLVKQICDVEEIRQRKFRVLLDANHGAGSLLGRQLLEELNCELTTLGETPDGKFAHPAEPTSENLATVLSQVPAAQADVGFCQDPDADRLAVIDEAGRYVGEEYTLAMCVEHVLRTRPGPVVTNCSTSRMTQDLAEHYAVPFYRSAVGEANVVQLMLKEKASFGGEGNGGVIDPLVGYVRDSFVGMALLLDAMAAREVPISYLANELPRYEIHKTKVQLQTEQVPQALDKLEERFSAATADRLDGLRLDWPDCWLLIRASNTEPIVRIVAEAPALVTARKLCEDAAETIAAL